MAHRNDEQKPGGAQPRKGTGSVYGDRLRQRLEEKLAQMDEESLLAPVDERMTPFLTSGQWAAELLLPQVAAPSLEKLRVMVPKGPELTQDEVIRRLHEHVRAHSSRRQRQAGEPVTIGDAVVLDILGYAEGRLIPFSARGRVEMELAAQVMLPGFAELLVGTPVGKSRQVDVTLPGAYPIESLRGVAAHFLVDVVSAQQVQPLDAASSEFLKRFKRGTTLEAVMESIVNELADERAARLWIEAQERVIDEIAGRTQATIARELIDEELHRRWEQAEAPLLRAKNFSPDELAEALAVWLVDRPSRVKAERDLRASLAFKAIIARDRVELTQQKLDAVLERAGKPFGLPPAEAREALKDPKAAPRIRALALQLTALEYVMSRATIQFEGFERTFSGRQPARR